MTMTHITAKQESSSCLARRLLELYVMLRIAGVLWQLLLHLFSYLLDNYTSLHSIVIAIMLTTSTE